MRYILYARKSSEEKTKQVQSIEDQIAVLQPLIQEKNREIVATLTESKSAKAPGRLVFNQMLEMIQKGQADAILCWHLNRLTRNEIDSGILRWMLRTGIIKEIVTPSRIYRPEDNALVTAVESAMGEQFLVELTASSIRGMRSKVEKGWFPGRCPVGYKNDAVNHTIIPDPERFDLLQRAWKEMLTGVKSVPQMQTMLNETWGFVGREGGKISRTTLYRVFTNPFYIGVFEWGGQTYPGKHVPMVTQAEFNKVQTLLGRAPEKPEKRNRKHSFTYSGLITCGTCGGSVCADRKRKLIKCTGEYKEFIYYACSKGTKHCQSGRTTEEKITEALVTSFEEIELPQEFYDFAAKVIDRHRNADREAVEQVRVRQSKALAQVEKQLDELLTLRLRGMVDDTKYESHQARLESERETLVENQQRTT
jgi:site-specific DNA recombinase